MPKYVVVNNKDEVVDGTVVTKVDDIVARFAGVALESGSTGIIPGVYRLVPVDLRTASSRPLREAHTLLQMYNWAVELESAGRLQSGQIKIETDWPERQLIVRQLTNDGQHWSLVARRKVKTDSRAFLRRQARTLEQAFIELHYAVE